MKRTAALVAVLLVASMLLPSLGSAQSEKNGIAVFEQAAQLASKAQSKEDRGKALEKYQEALDTFRKVKSEKWQASTLQRIALIYSSNSKYQEALEYNEKAVALHRKVGNVKGEATTLGNMGYIYRNLGQYQKALEYQEKALALHRKVSNLQGEGWALDGMGYVYRGMGQYQEALECYEKCLPIFAKFKDAKSEAATLCSMGHANLRLGEYQKARGNYEKALEISKKIGNVSVEGNSVGGIGQVYLELGQFQKALEYEEKALDIHRRIGNQRDEGVALNEIAQAYSGFGQYQKALENYEKALTIYRAIGELKEAATTLNNVGRIYFYWGDYQKALEYCNQALATQRKIGASHGEAWCCGLKGNIYHAWGQRQKALENFEKACELTRTIGDKKGESNNFSNIGRVCFGFGKYDDALKNYQRALEISNKIGVSTSSIKALIAWTYMEQGDLGRAEESLKDTKSPWWALGKLHLLKFQYDKAKIQYEDLLKSAEKNGNVVDLFTSYTGLGKVYEGLEDYKKSEEYYDKGMTLVEEIRSSLLPSERKDFFDVKVQGFERSEPAKGLTRVRLKLNKAAQGIDSSEATRARAFADAISLRSEVGYSGVPKEILLKEDELLTRVAALKKELGKTEKDKSPARYENLSKAAKAAEAEKDKFVEMLWANYKEYAWAKYPRPVTLKESSLQPKECVIMFNVSDEGVGIQLIKDKDIAQTYYTRWKLADLERHVKKFREPFEEFKPKEFDPELGQFLYKRLLLAVLADVPEGTPLIIIPDGILAVLPFESLVVSGKATWREDGPRPYPEGLVYLGDVHPISYYESITSLTMVRTMRSRKKTGGRTLVVADPVFGLNDPRLKSASRNEQQQLLAALPEKLMSIKDQTGLTFDRLQRTADLADSLKKLSPDKTDLYTGTQAKKSILFEKPLADYESIVLATHGYFGNDIPGVRESVIVMSLVGQSKDQDGFLRMSEVMGMRLNAEVVALTACQTGMGHNLAGEGVMSMGKAFQFAGAKSVLMSLWSVAETGSVLLTEKFFQHLREGKNKLDALKLAREDVRKAGFQHPFYWASFILVGEVN